MHRDAIVVKKRHAIFFMLIMGFVATNLLGCQTRSEIDFAFLDNPESCTCNGGTLSCTKLDGTVVTDPTSSICNEIYLNNLGICECSGTTLQCTADICHVELEDGICPGALTDTFGVTVCGGDFQQPLDGTKIEDHLGTLVTMYTMYPESTLCGGTGTPAPDAIPVTIAPSNPNSGQLPPAPSPAVSGGSCGAACSDSSQCAAGLACAGGVCWSAQVCEGADTGSGETTGGDTGGSTCTLTTESCLAQGYSGFDPATCSCTGKP